MQANFPQAHWKRSSDIAPIPKVWHIYQAKDKWGKIHEIRIQDITLDQREEVWDMYKEHFYPEMDLHRQVNIIEDQESMASEKQYFDHYIDQNLSIVAVLGNSGSRESPRIVGCLLLMVISKQDSLLPDLPGVIEAKLNEFFHFLLDDIDVFEKLNSNHLFKENGLVVKREYRRMNIGIELLKTMERMGNVFKIPAAVALLSTSTQSMGARLGFNMFKEVVLRDFKDKNGEAIFQELNDATLKYGYIKYFGR